MSKTVKYLGQKWVVCKYEWGLEDYFIIESSQGKLILVETWQDMSTGSVETKPVSKNDLTSF